MEDDHARCVRSADRGIEVELQGAGIGPRAFRGRRGPAPEKPGGREGLRFPAAGSKRPPKPCGQIAPDKPSLRAGLGEKHHGGGAGRARRETESAPVSGEQTGEESRAERGEGERISKLAGQHGKPPVEPIRGTKHRQQTQRGERQSHREERGGHYPASGFLHTLR